MKISTVCVIVAAILVKTGLLVGEDAWAAHIEDSSHPIDLGPIRAPPARSVPSA
jgi:hypothetical protein